MSTPQNPNTAALAQAGVSIWLDDLSRTRLDEGTLEELIATRSVTGVTTNPAIFQSALSKGTEYDEQVRELAGGGDEGRPAPVRQLVRAAVGRHERAERPDHRARHADGGGQRGDVLLHGTGAQRVVPRGHAAAQGVAHGRARQGDGASDPVRVADRVRALHDRQVDGGVRRGRHREVDGFARGGHDVVHRPAGQLHERVPGEGPRPELDEALLTLYFEYFERTGFLHRRDV